MHEEDFEGNFGCVITLLNIHHDASLSMPQALPHQGSTGSLIEMISFFMIKVSISIIGMAGPKAVRAMLSCLDAEQGMYVDGTIRK